MSEEDKRGLRDKPAPALETDSDDAVSTVEENLGREPLISIRRAGGKTYISGEIDLEELAAEIDESLAEGFEKFRETAEYNAQEALLDFITICQERKAELDFSDADLARMMDVSRSYISRVMNATPNLTVVSLAKLARALHGKIRINLVIDKSET